MARSKVRSLILLVPVASTVALFAAACGSSAPEQTILTNFFRASRVRDNTTLANIAAVSFDPRTEGTVQTFEVANATDEQRRTLQIKQLADEEAKARAEDAEFAKKKKEYQDANLAAIERVVKMERSGAAPKGKDAEVLATWSKWREEQSAYQKRLSEARAKLSSERALAVSSLTPPGRPDVDVTGMEVELITKQVTVNAQVVPPGGGAPTARTLVVTMQRASGKNGDQKIEGRWMITGIRQQGGGAPATN